MSYTQSFGLWVININNRILFALNSLILLLIVISFFDCEQSKITVLQNKIDSNVSSIDEVPYRAYFLATAHKGLLFRIKPDISSKAIGILPFGTKGRILKNTNTKEVIGGKEGIWLNVEHGKKNGWIFSGFTYMSDLVDFSDTVMAENYDLSSKNFMNPEQAYEIDGNRVFDKEKFKLIDSKKFIQGNYEITQNRLDELNGCKGEFNQIILKNSITEKEYLFNSARNEELEKNTTPFEEILMLFDECRCCCGGGHTYMYLMIDSGVYRIGYEPNRKGVIKCERSYDGGLSYNFQRENRYNVADKIVYTHIKGPKCLESLHRIDNPILEEIFVIIKINPRFPEIFRFYNQGIPAKYRDEWELAEREK